MLCIGTQVISVLFADTVIYNIAYPDPHMCEVRRTVDTCLTGRSPFESSKPLCYWNNDNGVCYLVEAKENTILLIYLAVLAIVCGVPVACLCCWLLTHVVGAPLAKQAHGNGASTRVAPVVNTEKEAEAEAEADDAEERYEGKVNDRFIDAGPVIILDDGEVHEPLQLAAMKLLREIDMLRDLISSPEEKRLFEAMW